MCFAWNYPYIIDFEKSIDESGIYLKDTVLCHSVKGLSHPKLFINVFSRGHTLSWHVTAPYSSIS